MTAPTKAGRYELLEELGRGSMGIVYRAHDPVIGRTVAVKTVRLAEAGTAMSHQELLDRFQTEARAAGLLSHPNIVVVYDAGEEDGLFYITMELVEGRSLQEQMNARQSFPLPRVMRWMQQACSALDFAHQHHVVHRDIKPANLMITPDDQLKISDFGTAKILQLGATQTAHVIGTPSYMSPEQVKGKAVDGRSDIFSLGIVLYELLTGAKPFSGDSVTTVIYKIVNEDPIPPRELDPSIHPGLSAIVNRALAKSPWTRFQDCREFAAALEDYQHFVDKTASPRATQQFPAQPAASVTPPRQTMTLSPAPVDPRVLEAAQKELAKNRGSFWIALLLLAIIGGAGYRVWPALQEIWQRSHAPSAEVAPAQTAAPETSETPPATPPATEPEPPANDTSTATPETTPSEPAPVPPVAAKAPVEKLPETKPPVVKSAIRKPSVLAASPAAETWKDHIEQTLSDSDLTDRVHVLAAGNTLTLAGKLDPDSHRQLLGKLQAAPAGVQIIDDIEYSEAPSAADAPPR